MSDSYHGLGPENRGACIVAAIVGLIALFFDLGRFFGDPASGTEDLWWRHIPVLLPTLLIVTITFFVCRAMIRKHKSDD
jgi:hypothetical protein